MLFRSNDTATTEIYTQFDPLSLHDALPICPQLRIVVAPACARRRGLDGHEHRDSGYRVGLVAVTERIVLDMGGGTDRARAGAAPVVRHPP